MIQRSRKFGLSPAWSSAHLADVGRGPGGECLWLGEPAQGHPGWNQTGLAALEPRCLLRVETRDAVSTDAILQRIDRELSERRADGLTGGTGIAVLLTYEALDPVEDRSSSPRVVVLAVDRSIAPLPSGEWRLTVRGEDADRVLDSWGARLIEEPPDLDRRTPARVAGSVTTSLPRERYLSSVGRLQDWIAEGRLYQGNLCQRIHAEFHGDPLAYYARLSRARPAPRSAYLSVGDYSLASLSPETFVTVSDGVIETYPIKGTRPRSADAEADLRALEELRASAKDRAELLMIVDLERNDLGRLCRPGSVSVPELAGARSFPAVHHLVARVRGELEGEVRWSRMIRAIFPGGSITGAPKESAMRHLRELEPVPRGAFTGCLFWCGDDGRIDSSILIRSAEFGAREVSIGAGGGIVSDSDPLAEWAESNHKARTLTEALGFSPEDAR